MGIMERTRDALAWMGLGVGMVGVFWTISELYPYPSSPRVGEAYLRLSQGGAVDIETSSYFQEIQKSMGSFIVGMILFCASSPLLVWNECQAARYYRMLFRARDALRKGQGKERVNIDTKPLHREKELVCVHGKLDTNSRLITDSDFHFELENCVRLKRKVEMLQWVEHKHSTTEKDMLGNKVTRHEYTYSKEWRENHVNSEAFHEAKYRGHNPTWWIKARSRNFDQKVVNFGTEAKLLLHGAVIKQMGWYSTDNLSVPLDKFQEKLSEVSNQNASARSEGDAGVYIAYNPGISDVGDIKISYIWVPDSNVTQRHVTVMGELRDSNIIPWSDSGDFMYDKVYSGCVLACCCPCTASSGSSIDDYAIETDEESPVLKPDSSAADYKTFNEKPKGWFDLLNAADGEIKASTLLKQNENSERCLQTILRLVGWLMMVFGLYMVFEPLLTILDIIPIIGPIVRISVFLLVLIVTTVLSALIIAVAWISSRPMVALAAIVVIGMVVGLTVWFGSTHNIPAKPTVAGG
ncbi:hypothetical protein AAMO2058_000159100 [Amorphochlora amoebiformis]